MAKILVSKYAIELTQDELFKIRVLLKDKLATFKTFGENCTTEQLELERLYDDFNIDKF